MRPAEEHPAARVRVKICGITRPADALAAACLGADAIGLVFYTGSPRAISIDRARDIVAVLPPFVSKVGLFVNARPEEINAALENVALDILQFHGDESPDQCRGYSKPYIKAVRMRKSVDLESFPDRFSDAMAFLLDAHVAGIRGGTGQTFDWSRIPAGLAKPIILAGGLTSENVAEAIRRVSPYAVDVSGGVESGKGIKDPAKIAEFIREVRNAQS